ncbi:MAG TPA: S-adenosylmethionine:tRNA ribosyltransferase-isomerase [Acidimicrobiales bacterium]|nr:S-adenosylmethionine:tRNA ribosyltransferase-isomerase [Acidimicrobiales bacterium]
MRVRDELTGGRPLTVVPGTTLRLDRLELLGGFRIPEGGEAGTPPELRRPGGVVGDEGRGDVRLMVARRTTGTVTHRRFADLVDELAPGDIVVVNASAVLPAALDARAADGTPFRLHLSTEQPGGFWVVEPRVPAGPGSARFTGEAPPVLFLPAGGTAELLAPFPAATPVRRLWLARLDLPALPPVAARPGPGTVNRSVTATAPVVGRYLARHGQPIRYTHTDEAWPLDAYQTVFAREPGSVEMPSASRPFTDRLVSRLLAAGVAVVPITLHTGVSSQDAGEPPYAERYSVPAATADAVNAARAAGRRIVAAGTTVVRALETTADPAGRSHPGHGRTELVVSPARGVRVVDGLITGWHEPESSHLALLEAVAGRPLLEASYRAAVAERYLWHEFGDSHLILP